MIQIGLMKSKVIYPDKSTIHLGKYTSPMDPYHDSWMWAMKKQETTNSTEPHTLGGMSTPMNSKKTSSKTQIGSKGFPY